MNNNEVYRDFIYSRIPTSALDVAQMHKQRNPIIETDKNIEKMLCANQKQISILNSSIELSKENTKNIDLLTQQIKEMQETSSKEFKINLRWTKIACSIAFSALLLQIVQYIIHYLH